jgi:hypothetical protein
MLDQLRHKAYGVLASSRGDRIPPVKWARSALRYANDVVGRPLAPREELEERRAFEERRATERAAESGQNGVRTAREPAPVVVFHTDKQPRELARLEEHLTGAGVTYKVRDISDDEAAIAATRRDSGGHGFPVAFVAGDPIGGPQEVAALARSGKLTELVFGPA